MLVVLATNVISPARALSAEPFSLGIDDYGPLGAGNPAASSQWIARASADGATFLRLSIGWSAIAPRTRPSDFDAANPASQSYNWAPVDNLVREAAAKRLSILMQLTGAPGWAEGPDKPSTAAAGTWMPSAQAFGQFARAAALRYSGHFTDPLEPGHYLPSVRYWEAWDEPNLSEYLTPQWTLSGGRYVPASPTIYRHLLNAFYTGVKSVSKQNVVVGGGTAPFGDTAPSLQYAVARIPPATFVRDMLCLGGGQPCGEPAHFDVLDHHPFDIGAPTQPALNPGDVSTPDMGKLTRLLRAARKAGKLAPRTAKQVWATELFWVSKPPDSTGVPILRQARWLEQGLYVLWKQGVDAVFWLQIVDDPPHDTTGLDAGLYFHNGRPKPAVTAYRFPFVTVRTNAGTIRAWGRAPATGTIVIQRLEGRRWRTLKHLKLKQHAVFFTPLNLRGSGQLRAREGQLTSLTWPQS